MTRLFLSITTAFALLLTACTKEAVQPDVTSTCLEQDLLGDYQITSGTVQASAAAAPSNIPDSQIGLKMESADCSKLRVYIGGASSFEANCSQNGDLISGSSDDGSGTFSYYVSSKKFNATKTEGSGEKYTINALKQ